MAELQAIARVVFAIPVTFSVTIVTHQQQGKCVFAQGTFSSLFCFIRRLLMFLFFLFFDF
jgi:uncharacterized MnhB-related membrane protein